MVSLSQAELGAKADQIRRSVDLAVGDLLASEADPFALANYLWTTSCHHMTLVNGSCLAAWGKGWAYRVLAERDTGRRADETIASAALAAASLAKRLPSNDTADIVAGLHDLLAAELSVRKIPFNSPAYAAAVLFAARVVGVDEPRIGEGAAAVAVSITETASHGQIFGVSFAVQLLQKMGAPDRLSVLARAVQQALTNPLLGYEDQLYLVQALVQMHATATLPEPIVDLAEQVLVESPIWSYLTVGVEDVEPAGDGRTAVHVSHLYRAALFDVALRLQADATNREEARRDERYRGRVTIGVFASLGIALSLLFLWALIGWAMAPSVDEARRYWLSNEYDAMTPGYALVFLLGFLAVLFLAMLTVVVSWTLWTLLIRSAVESDRRLFELLGRRALKVVGIWLTVTLAVIGIANAPLLHALGEL